MSGSGKAISALPTPQNGGATPTPTPTPLPYSPENPADPAAYVHVSRPLLHVIATRPSIQLHIIVLISAQTSQMRCREGTPETMTSELSGAKQSLFTWDASACVGACSDDLSRDLMSIMLTLCIPAEPSE